MSDHRVKVDLHRAIYDLLIYASHLLIDQFLGNAASVIGLPH